MKTKKQRTRAWPVILATGASIVGIAGLTVSAKALQDEVVIDIEDTRTALEEWVELRRVISNERRNWILSKDLLEGRIEVVSGELEALRTELGDAEGSIGEADEKRAELLEESQGFEEAFDGLEGRIDELEARTRTLLQRLPEPIRDTVKPLSQKIPDDPETTDVPLADRFQNVVGILNLTDKFQREITLTSEVRDLGDGSTAEVTAMYVGISQGYFVTANGEAAGIGFATEEGWVWTSANEAAPEITKAIAIFNNEQIAEFVSLPVQVQ